MSSHMERVFQVNIEKHMPLKEVVFRALREAIIQGEYTPGDRLLEIQLSELLGVSRTPVREALHMLQDEGLVLIIPRRGAIVAGITEKRMSDVLEVRKAMEELAVRLCCDRIGTEDLERLEESEREFERLVGSDDINEIAAADENFHHIISEATGNHQLTTLLTGFREQMYRFRVVNLKNRQLHSRLIEEHKDILREIAVRNKGAAVEAVKKHIDGQQRVVLETVRAEKEAMMRARNSK